MIAPNWYPNKKELICVDEENRVVSTPAYMLAQNVGDVFTGISALVNRVMEMAKAD